MREHVEKMRRALEEMAGEWVWQLSFCPLPGKQRLKVLARNKRRSETTRSFLIDQLLLERLTVGQWAGLFAQFLPGAQSSLEIECQLHGFEHSASATHSTKPQSDPVRARGRYDLLRETYRADLRELRSRKGTLTAREAPQRRWARLLNCFQH